MIHDIESVWCRFIIFEGMDEFTLSAFVEEAAKTDIQFIVSRVTEDPELTISTAE